jgi:hypothetical protein
MSALNNILTLLLHLTVYVEKNVPPVTAGVWHTAPPNHLLHSEWQGPCDHRNIPRLYTGSRLLHPQPVAVCTKYAKSCTLHYGTKQFQRFREMCFIYALLHVTELTECLKDFRNYDKEGWNGKLSLGTKLATHGFEAG